MKNFLTDINNHSRNSDIKKSIFVHCIEHGHSTIPQISKALNYSVPTVTKHVTDLCKGGFFSDYGKVESREGRPANIYGINPESCYFIGVDFSEEYFNIAIVNLIGDVIDSSLNRNFKLQDSTEGIDDICNQVLAFIEKAHNENKIDDPNKIINININITGRINSKTGFSHTIFTTEIPLTTILSQKLGYNVTIENDSRAKTYGEYHAIREENPSVMLCVNIDLGTAMGTVVDGKIITGKSGFAGEIGHSYSFDNEIICKCGKKGCFETEVSGSALKREVIKNIKSGKKSILSERVLAGDDLSIFDIIDAINISEDVLCIEIIESIGMKLGTEIANLINMFNPDIIVISGLISRAGDFLLNPVKMSVRKHSLKLVSNDTKVITSNINYEAGVVGACLIARNKVLDIHQ